MDNESAQQRPPGWRLAIIVADSLVAHLGQPGDGWNFGELTADAGATSWHMSAGELIDVMGCFRRQGTIMSTAAAQNTVDGGFGIDLTRAEPHLLPAAQPAPSALLANSQIGVPAQFFRHVVTNIDLGNIAPEITIGGWIARHSLTARQYPAWRQRENLAYQRHRPYRGSRLRTRLVGRPVVRPAVA